MFVFHCYNVMLPEAMHEAGELEEDFCSWIVEISQEQILVLFPYGKTKKEKA